MSASMRLPVRRPARLLPGVTVFALVALALARCDCGQPCQADSDCASDQICARGVCSPGNRLTVDAAVQDASSADAGAGDGSAADQVSRDRASGDRAAGDVAGADLAGPDHAPDASRSDTSAGGDRHGADGAARDGGAGDGPQPPTDSGVVDVRYSDARLIDARSNDARRFDRRQPDTAVSDGAGFDKSGFCMTNGQLCSDGDMGTIEDVCLDGVCLGYVYPGEASCTADCTWPPGATTCLFAPEALNTEVCHANCRCALDTGGTSARLATCESHSVCNDSVVQAVTVDFICNSEANCYFYCLNGATCNVTCAAGALCRVYCFGAANCNLGACPDGAWLDCGLGVNVCHRQCPVP